MTGGVSLHRATGEFESFYRQLFSLIKVASFQPISPIHVRGGIAVYFASLFAVSNNNCAYTYKMVYFISVMHGGHVTRIESYIEGKTQDQLLADLRVVCPEPA